MVDQGKFVASSAGLWRSSIFVDSEKQLCLIGANFAFRRRAFEKVGCKTDFQRVKAVAN